MSRAHLIAVETKDLIAELLERNSCTVIGYRTTDEGNANHGETSRVYINGDYVNCAGLLKVLEMRVEACIAQGIYNEQLIFRDPEDDEEAE